MKILKNKKFGFTLAEVLVTLTVLGVIAAITVPGIIRHYKKQAVVTGLKEAYSMLNNWVTMAEAVNGPVYSWSYPNSNRTYRFENVYLYPYFNYQKACRIGYSSMNVYDCFKKSNNPISNVSGGYIETNNIKNQRMYDTWWRSPNGLLLKNGMTLGYTIITFDSIIFMVDINGPKKGKSMLGEDLFVFTFCPFRGDSIRNRNKIYLGYAGIGCYSGDQPERKNLEEILSADVYANYTCNINGGSFAGANCSAAIYKNGWKIPKNYPIKF